MAIETAVSASSADARVTGVARCPKPSSAGRGRAMADLPLLELRGRGSSLGPIGEQRVLVVRTRTLLDLTATDLVLCALELAIETDVAEVVVDLRGTESIRDSGLALLLLLEERLAARGRRVTLANIRARLLERVSRAALGQRPLGQPPFGERAAGRGGRFERPHSV